MLYVYYRFALFIPKFILKNRKIAKQKFKTKKKEKKKESQTSYSHMFLPPFADCCPALILFHLFSPLISVV